MSWLNQTHSSKVPNPPPKDCTYSTLEVDHTSCRENDGAAAPIVGQDPKNEKIFGFDDGKIVSYSDATVINDGDVDRDTMFVDDTAIPREAPPSVEERKIWGLQAKTLKMWLIVIAIVIIVIAIGAGVGGSMATRKRVSSTITPPTSPASPPPQARYNNTGLAAMQWTDLDYVLHKKIYYQDNSNRIRESAWDNSTAFDAAWDVNVVSKAVQPGTAIAAVAGYPRARQNDTLIQIVYCMTTKDRLTAILAAANDTKTWIPNELSDFYVGTPGTSLAAYWNQDFEDVSQDLIVLFQKVNFANGITQARSTSNYTTSYKSVLNNFGFSHPKGASFAMSFASYRTGKLLMLYTLGDGNELIQHQHLIGSTKLDQQAVISTTLEALTGLIIEPQSPLAVVAQDNQPLFTEDTMPGCTEQTPLTNLILFTVPDSSSLMLNAWNCSSGFEDHTAEIEPLQKPDTVFLALAGLSDKVSGDGSVFIMFDSGTGSQVEEWIVPKRAGDPWETKRSILVDFDA